MNGGKHKSDDELKLDLSDGLSLKQVIKQACKRFGYKDNMATAKMYNKDGVLLLETDFSLIASGDVLYFSPKGTRDS